MAIESSTQADDWNSAREALAEIRACTGELKMFLAGIFDQLEHSAGEVLAQETAWQRGQREALQAQVDRLAMVASELTGAVAQQKLLADQKKKRRDGEEG